MKRLNCILLVDDDSVNNFLNQKLFAKLDVADKVEIIEDAENALAFLDSYHRTNQCHPEVIFIDVNMPAMNGFEFVSRFKETYPQNHGGVKIIMLTAALSKYDKLQIEESNVSGSMEKPLTKEKVELILNI
jgi:CheY-like chemotaxis protein